MGLVHGIPTGRTATVLVARKQGVPTTVGHDGHHLGTLWIVGGREGGGGWGGGRGGGRGGGTNGQEDRTTKSQYPTQPNRSFLASTATSTYLVVNGFVGVLCSKTNADKQQQAHEKQRRGKYFQSFRTFTFDGHHPKDIDHEHHDAPDNRKNEWSRQSWKERRERTGEENEKEKE
jgi:hypothetical protein